MIARSGTYHVVSRVVDDDGEIYASESGYSTDNFKSSDERPDFEWSFKLAKEW